MTAPRLAFDANTFPLEEGVQLLEASAGTGKTFALAHLVLRLVTRPQEPLRLEQLLVVTFTEAAAAELRDRIARRLQEALALLEPEAGDRPPGDAVLAAWLEAQPPGAEGRGPLRGRLLLALEELDRADITTIHGFCRRTLQRQALEAGLGPAVELESDGAENGAQVCHDYWQQQVLPLPAGFLAGLELRGLAPELLRSLLQRLDGDPALDLDPLPAGLSAEQPLAGQLESLWPRLWERFVAEWRQRGEALEQAFCRLPTDLKAGGSSAKATPYAAKPRSDRVALVHRWLEEREGVPDLREVLELSRPIGSSGNREQLLLEYFHPAPYAKASAPISGGDSAPESPLPEAPLLEAIAALVDGPLELSLLHFAHWGRAELRRRRGRAGRMGFGELLEGLDPGLDGTAHGELITAVRQRYRVALIDEFQDTDPIQWRILEQAFAAPQAPGGHLLVMVGDPKQAIYRFRGGELATYRQARQRALAIHELRENRRSSEPLVAALNALMGRGMVRSELEVPAVVARADKGELALEPGESPLQLLPYEQEAELPERTAALCLQLLERNLGLQPQDLCLLVSRHDQAEELRRALERRGLPSRLVSRGDVFSTEGATALQRLLDALADPASDGRRRLLAASPLLGWSAEELAAAPPQRWAALAERIGQLSERLPRLGLLGVLAQLLSTEGMARLSLGGRLLADLQQSAELVQERIHQQGLAVEAAADWLRRLRHDPERAVPEPHQLHSDAADSAVAVVTVHRSKGLEYPVVICPYLWRAPSPPKAGAREIGRRWRPPGREAPHLDLHLSPHWGQGRRAALQDHLADQQESERLAYVALTRARHLLVLGWLEPPPEKHRTNPLSAWLLEAGGGLRSPDDLPLHRIEPESLPAPGRRWQRPAPEGELAAGPVPRHRIDTRWSRGSYSAWTQGRGSLTPAALEEGRDADEADRGGEEENAPRGERSSQPPEAASTWERTGPLADFPRGPAAGDCLHRILERIDYRRSGHDPDGLAVVAEELQRSGLSAALGDGVAEAIEQLRHTPLGGALGTFHLAELAPEERLNELRFDLPLAVEAPQQAAVSAAGLARAFAEHPGGLVEPSYARRLAELEVSGRGFLTGSIDLVFRTQGRWWVLDWKSNWIGERTAEGQPLACGPAHYDLPAMVAQMEHHHYLLQAHLYQVALHRYLRWRLPGYRAERDLGGSVYVFLRGVPGSGPAARHAAQQGSTVPGVLVEPAPLERLLALDALLERGEVEERS
ncbi:MAG: UvrD-helicase domain-containing protein [Prochlorococcaceae cyanobacterium]|jgi:exodeoxyribonuclease V beta subunit